MKVIATKAADVQARQELPGLGVEPTHHASATRLAPGVAPHHADEESGHGQKNAQRPETEPQHLPRDPPSRGQNASPKVK